MKRLFGAAAASVIALLLCAAPAWASFGLSEADVTYSEQDGSEATQAGSHPFAMTTTFAFNASETAQGGELADEPAKDIYIAQVPGLVGDPAAIPQCSGTDFLTRIQVNKVNVPDCPDGTAVGEVGITLGNETGVGGAPVYSAVYELEPPPGVAAELGFWTAGVPVMVELSVNDVAPYNVIARSANISQIVELIRAQFTLWGVPADPAHDALRGHCLDFTGASLGQCHVDLPLEPFLTLPRACAGPLETVFTADSWVHPGEWTEVAAITHDGSEPLGMTGCGQLAFAPSIAAAPTTRSASSPTGLEFSLDVNDEGLTSPRGDAESDIKKVTVTLPEGMTANPALAEGVQACSEADLQRETIAAQFGEGCPAESKIGTVEVETPLLEPILKGSLFLASPYANPFGSLLALYVVIKNPQTGVLIKLPGEVATDEATGQLTSIFDDLPQLPFSHFRLKFREGERSPLVTPPACGTYTTGAQLSPWARPSETLADASTFTVSSGVGGGACPAGGLPPFDPTLEAGAVNDQAGAYSPLSIRIARNDGEQEITGLSALMPPGLTANLTGVPFCSEAEIQHAREQSGASAEVDPACPAASQIGHTLVGVGVGTVLAYNPGLLFMAGPYQGAPFSIVAITSAKVGPFDLGTVVVHLPLHIDPRTAQVSIPQGAADQIPHIVKGIVVQVRDIRVYVDRKDFMRNPTSCAPMSLEATVFGAGRDFASAADDTSSTVSDRFQAADCAALPFEPKLTAQTHAHHTRKDGAYLQVAMQSSIRQAGVREVHVELPKALPSELKTLQKACTETQFATDPAGCPAESVVGSAEVQTPILPAPLKGPAYFVSHGGAKFPELIMVLEGYGVTIELNGETFISKKGITSATFRSVPDQPFTKFQLTLPTDSHSALAGNGDFCHERLAMPTRIVAQSGKLLEQRTKIAVKGCRPEMWLLKHSVRRGVVRIAVEVPSAGKLRVRADGLRGSVRKVVRKGGRVQIAVPLKRHERRRGESSKVTLKLTFDRRHGGKLRKTITLRTG